AVSMPTTIPNTAPGLNNIPLPPLSNLTPDLPVEFGDNISLIGFSFSPSSNLQEQSLPIALTWEISEPPKANYTAFVHLIDENGQLVAQIDEPLEAFSMLDESKNINAVLNLPLSENLPPGTYTITTGLYDNRTGQQLPQNNNGQGFMLAMWEVFAPHQLTKLPVDLGDNFHLIDFALSPKPYQPGQPLEVSLAWETTGQPTADYTAFVHLLGENGKLIAQADQSLGESSTFTNGTRPTSRLTLWLPDNLESSTLRMTTGLYDANTGQRLPQNDNGADLYLAQIEVSAETAVIHHATIIRTQNNGLTLRDKPDGQQIAILNEGSIVLLADAPRVEHDDFIWQAVETVDGLSGWVAADFLTYPSEYTPSEVVPAPFPPFDQVWVISAKQISRASANDPITFEITLGVELVSADEGILKLFYSNPAWHTGSEGQLPIHMIGGDQIVDAGKEIVTVTAVLDPTEMKSNVQTNAPILTTQLGTLNPNKPLQSSFETSIMSVFTNVQFDLQSLDNISYQFWDQGIVRFTSATQKERVTAVVVFEIMLELQTKSSLTMNLYLAHPDWDLSQTLDQAMLLLPNENVYQVTATPTQIREATGTDYPIVVAILEPRGNSTGTAIVERFGECPMDLTRSDKFTCSP
ncbi:MAG: SH3 domain-containing protein, partial [Chloroflexi bacterium]